MFQRMQKNCLHFFYLLAACSFFYTTSVALFWNRTNIPMMVVAVACGLAVAFLLHKLIFSPGFSMVAEDPRKRRLVIAGISGLFLVLCLASAFLQVEDFSGCDWDIWVIHTEAENVARNPFPDRMLYAEYFWELPHNAFPLAVFTGWYRLWWLIGGESVDFNVAAVILSCLALWSAHLLFYHATRLFLGNREALLAAVFWMLFLPFYGFVATPYTDTMAIPLCAAVLFFLANYYRTKQLRWVPFLGLFTGLGCLMKGTFYVIAVAVFLWLAFFQLKKWKTHLLSLALAAILFAAPVLGFPVFYEKSGIWNSVEYEADFWKYPPTHWLMMSQNPNGPWAAEDFAYTKQLAIKGWSYERRFNQCLEVYFDRIQNRGLFTTLVFSNRKVVETWGDGTMQFAQYERDTFYHPHNGLIRFFDRSSPQYPIYFYSANGIYFSALICTAAGMIFRLFRRDRIRVDGPAFAHLCLFGMFLFELLWEWRSRYLFVYLPFLMLCVPYGLECLHSLYQSIRARWTRAKPSPPNPT